MIALSPRKINFETLCKTVEQRLCEIGHLEPHQFPMTQREVVRGGKICGVYFCVHGPRSVKLTAICDFTHNTLIYYGSDGIRRESVNVPVAQPMPMAQAA
jgi:hypothetical protein